MTTVSLILIAMYELHQELVITLALAMEQHGQNEELSRQMVHLQPIAPPPTTASRTPLLQ